MNPRLASVSFVTPISHSLPGSSNKEHMGNNITPKPPTKLKQLPLVALLPKKRKLDGDVSALQQNTVEKKLPNKSLPPPPPPPPPLGQPLQNPKSRFDIANIANLVALTTNQQKYNYMCNVWKPEPSYSFPVTEVNGVRRKFQYQWLTMYPWLAYSKECDGALY